jgi:hypothetical protein
MAPSEGKNLQDAKIDTAEKAEVSETVQSISRLRSFISW